MCRLLDLAGGDHGQVGIVEGEAGGGKTRLLVEVEAEAVGRGFQTAVGAAEELEVDRPFGAVIEALALEPGSTDVERSELGRTLAGGSEGGHIADLGYRLVDQAVALLERLTSVGPVAVILEDLHWADALTLRFVRAVGRAVPQLSVALFVSLRPYPRRPELDRVMSDLVATGATHVALGALDDRAVGDLAADVAGAPAGPHLAAHLGRTGGNPLFVIEVLRGLRDEGALVVAGGYAEVDLPALPATVQAAIRRRTGFLPPSTLEVLTVASVLGTRFPLVELAAVMAATPVQLMGRLGPAIEAGLLGDDQGALAFRHELIRDAIYSDLPAPVRKGLHREIAGVLAGRGTPTAEVADHLFAGASPGDAEAVSWLADAALRLAVRSPATAVVLLERAVELADPSQPETDVLVCDLAPLLIQTGRATDAQRLSRRVLDRGPITAVEVGLRRALGEVLWARGWLEAALAELEAALAEMDEAVRVPGASDLERVGPAALAANIRLFVGEPAEARSQATEALAAGRQLEDDFAVSLALQTLAMGAAADGRGFDAVTMATEAVAVANRSSQPRIGQLHPHLYLGLILVDADRLDEAEAMLQEGRRRAEQRGAVVWVPLYQWAIALVQLLRGAWDNALAEVDVGLAVADEVGTRLHVPFLHGITAWVALKRGDLVHAQERMEAAVTEFLGATSETWQAEATARGLRAAGARWPMEWGLWIAGLIHEAHGDREQALAVVEDAWAVAAPLRYLLGHRFFAPDLVRLALAAGNHHLAQSVTTDVEEGARRTGTASADGAALRCRGLLREDPDMLLAAVHRYRGQPSVIELAFALDDAGAALARAGRRPEAIAAFEEALGVHDRVGATRSVSATEAALRTLGVRRRRPSQARRALIGWESLTATELVVARLAAEGLTNRQVGERLFVSRRTVETHMAHVFAKLGVSSRAQLGVEVARNS